VLLWALNFTVSKYIVDARRSRRSQYSTHPLPVAAGDLRALTLALERSLWVSRATRGLLGLACLLF
jgi:hypothetical protein